MHKHPCFVPTAMILEGKRGGKGKVGEEWRNRGNIEDIVIPPNHTNPKFSKHTKRHFKRDSCHPAYSAKETPLPVDP